MGSLDVYKNLPDRDRSHMTARDLGQVIASLEKMNERLQRLEAKIALDEATTRSQQGHPSVDKFSIAEAIADQIFAGAEKEKACTFEPNNRPCDHCSMCSSRGF